MDDHAAPLMCLFLTPNVQFIGNPLELYLQNISYDQYCDENVLGTESSDNCTTMKFT